MRAVCLLALSVILWCATIARADVAQDIEQLMGGRTKIVWLRCTDWEELRQPQGATDAIDTTRFKLGFDSPDTAKRNTVTRPGASPDGGGASLYQPTIGHIFDKRGSFAVMVFDTAEGKERELVPVGWNFNPLITPDGTQVIYSTGIPPWAGPGRKICCINTDGTGQRVLHDGFAQWIWKDPASGTVWVYYSDDNGRDSSVFSGISRLRLDDPTMVEKVYSGNISNRFSLSADGTHAAGEFPWPQAGLLDLTTGTLTTQGFPQGCNTYLAPDNSYRMSVFTGSHTDLVVMQPDGTRTQFSIRPPAMHTLKDGGKGVLWNPKWAGDSQHLVACGPFKNLASDRADIWLGEYAPDYTAVTKWVQVTNTDAMDTYAYVWVATDLGAYTGETPYTVTMTMAKAGEWAWSFGDGATATGVQGKHTYTKAGKYTITARLNGVVKTGVVEVLPRVAPTITGTTVVDEYHLLVTFSEPVQGKTPRIVLQSGTPVKTSTWSNDGKSLWIEVAKKLPSRDTVRLTGITDLAQTPNPLANARSVVAASAWPSNRVGLAYLWETRQRPSYLWVDGAVTTTEVVGGGNARFTRFGSMLLKGSAFRNNEASFASARTIPTLCNRSQALSLEVTLQSATLAQGKDTPTPIITLPGGLTLAQQEHTLLFTLATATAGTPAAQQTARLVALPDTGLHHLVVTYGNGRLVCYLDGKRVTASTAITGVPAMTATGPLQFGAQGWQGKLEGVALYTRVLPPAEVNANATAYLKVLHSRKMPAQLTVQAKLTAVTPIPRATDILPYRNALVVNDYAIEKVVNGTYQPATIRVAQWGVLDGKETSVAALQVGSSTTLTLEAYSDHPELESELLKDTLPENDDLALYVEAE